MQFETNSMFSCRFSGPLSASSEFHLLLLSERFHSVLRLNQGPSPYSAYPKREVRRTVLIKSSCPPAGAVRGSDLDQSSSFSNTELRSAARFFEPEHALCLIEK
jgi:hypothetical protein